MKKARDVFGNESGAALVIVLLVLMLLTLIGKTMIDTSRVDVEMAGNHSRYTRAFHGADGGTEIACELLEQNLMCPMGFTDNTGGAGTVIGIDPDDAADPCQDGVNALNGVRVNDRIFKNHSAGGPPQDIASSDLYFPADMTDNCNWPHTRINAGMFRKRFRDGYSSGDNRGYENDIGAAKGGTEKMYQIFSRRIEDNEDVTVTVRWRHVVGLANGDCNY